MSVLSSNISIILLNINGLNIQLKQNILQGKYLKTMDTTKALCTRNFNYNDAGSLKVKGCKNIYM